MQPLKITELSREAHTVRNAFVVSALIWAIPMNWIAQIGVILAVWVVLMDLSWRSSWTYRLNPFVRALISIGLSGLVGWMGYIAVSEQYEKEHPADNLKAIFVFPDWRQIGVSQITFNAIFFNQGKKQIIINEINALAATLQDSSFNSTVHNDMCDLSHVAQAEYAMMFKLHIPTSTHILGGKDGIIYQPLISSVHANTIDASSVKSIQVSLDGFTKPEKSNVMEICPVIDYFSADGTQHTAVCRGYNVVEVTGGAMMGTATFAAGEIKTARLLPRNSNSLSCETISQ